MLVVQTGQLTTGDFHPIRFAALSAVPLTGLRMSRQPISLAAAAPLAHLLPGFAAHLPVSDSHNNETNSDFGAR
jgi:hypothetical protein